MPEQEYEYEQEYYYVAEDGTEYGPFESEEDAEELGPQMERDLNS